MTWKLLLSFLAVPVGAILFYLAELDDSPGGQLIALVIAFLGAIHIVKAIKKRRK